jgi:hypothetical protein
MNIISCNRALHALDSKIKDLEQRRRRAKDKQRWDEKNGGKLSVAERQARILRVAVMRLLQAQGQFDHALDANQQAGDERNA